MAKIHTLTYNGTKSSDLGVFVTGSGSFDAAELDVDKYEIPGRNGDLILSNNRYKNIEITYPAFIPKAFMDKAQNVRNWLRSSRVYARLEDTYDTDHYRLGIPTGVQSFSPANRNDGANFEMTFDCKPQRFLKVGETPETVEADVQTESGEIVTFETIAESPMTSAEVSFSPVQDLNGYDSPWAGGANINKLPPPVDATQTSDGVTISVKNGVYTISGTATATHNFSFPLTASVDISPSTNKIAFLNSVSVANINVQFTRNGSVVHYWQMQPINRVASGWTDSGNEVIDSVTIRIAGTGTYNLTISPMLLALTEAAPTSFSPYSNICPISGHTGVTLYVSPTTSSADATTYPVSFSSYGTVYGGTFDWVSGKLMVTHANIASYNGETLPGAWISDRDVYAAGTTPTTGAQVAYELATPIEIDLTPTEVETLLGENNVWSDEGPITLTYAEPYTIENPTIFDARPLFTVTNPAEGDVIMVNGQAITFVDGYSGTVFIDCETMNAYSGAANLNSIIEATDFPVLVPGTNIITWTGTGVCTMTPRWWEL